MMNNYWSMGNKFLKEVKVERRKSTIVNPRNS